MNQSKRNWKSPLLLLLTATIWGVAFVAQSVGMEYVGPFTFNGVRSLLGAVVLLPVIYFMDIRKKAADRKECKTLWLGGLLCGLCLCAASTLQQFGIQYTTAGKAGFLTAMYIVMVPIISFVWRRCKLYRRRKARSIVCIQGSPLIGVSVILAIVGLYLLSIKDGFRIGTGDIYIMICAVIFAVHILVIDYFSPKCDGVKMSCIQFAVCGVICTALALIVERPQIGTILQAWLPIGYAGVMSCGVAYTLQIVGQKGMNPTVASLIMSLESVISVLAGWLILRQSLSVREMIGCVVMFGAIVLAQLPEKGIQSSCNNRMNELK